MINKGVRFFSSLALTFGLCAGLLFQSFSPVLAAETAPLAELQEQTLVSWPQGPEVTAGAAILIEASTGTILYSKNIHEQNFPASTTKVLTALIAMEECSMDEMVEYSSEAVNSINWREDSNIGIKVGESITMEQTLYGLMVGSGNECGNAIGEHISGSIEAFVDKMNRRAAELGCQNTHFVTTNGIHDDNHYTSAYDLAQIAREYFTHDLLCKMSSTLDYVIPQSDTLSQKLIPFTKNKLLPGRTYAYDGLVGSKTGYTSIAKQNLVSCAERNGMRLICVVMKDESPDQFTDTVDLFNFGFSNFQMVNVAENDTRYTVRSSGFLDSAQDIFGDSTPLLYMDPQSSIVLPNGALLEHTESFLDYEALEKGQAAKVHYSYNGEPVGDAAILLSQSNTSFDFDKDVTAETQTAALGVAAPNEGEQAALIQNGPNNSDPSQNAADPAAGQTNGALSDSTNAASSAQTSAHTGTSSAAQNTVFLNVKTILFWVCSVAGLIILVLITFSAIHNHMLSKRRKAIMKRRRENNQLINLDRYTSSMDDLE